MLLTFQSFTYNGPAHLALTYTCTDLMMLSANVARLLVIVQSLSTKLLSVKTH